MHAYRTHTCAELGADDVGQTVRLSGWVHRKRDHGHLLFVDLRDHYGLTQIVADAASPAFKTLDRIRVESVVTIEGDMVSITTPAELSYHADFPAVGRLRASVCVLGPLM